MILLEKYKKQLVQRTWVYISQATHGCVENRGVRAHSSLTQTTVLKGAFLMTLVQRKSLWITLNYNNNTHVTSNEFKV